MNSSRFPSFISKSKQSTGEKGGTTAKSSSQHSSASASPSNSSSTTTSKSRINKPPPGLPKTPTKGMLKTCCPPSNTKKSTTGSKASSPPIQSSTSDDLSKALVLKKKNSKRNSSPALQRKQSKKCSSKESSTNTANESIISEKIPDSVKMHHEGPLQIQEGNFDFYSILARPKVWELDDEEDDTKGVNGRITANEIKIQNKFAASASLREEQSSYSSGLIRGKESEIWGSMRESTPEESTHSSRPPSLTSIGENEKKACATTVDSSKVKVNEEEMMGRDENNNVLEAIKNTIYRSLTFFEIARPSTTTTTTTTTIYPTDDVRERNWEPNRNRKETVPLAQYPVTQVAAAVLDYDKENRQGSFSTSKELDQVNETEGKINAQPCLASNIHNSPAPLGIFLRGSRPNLGLIPVEITEQLQYAFGIKPSPSSYESQQEHCIRHLKNHFNLPSKLQESESGSVGDRVSEEEDGPPPLTIAEAKIKDSSSSELVLNRRKEKEEEQTDAVHETDRLLCVCKDEGGICAEPISPTSSHQPSSPGTTSPGEEKGFADTIENSEEFDSQQTQTQIVDSHDAETGTEAEEDKKTEKMMSLVMAVNAGIDIKPEYEQQPKKKRRGIMKTSARGSTLSLESVGSMRHTSQRVVTEKVQVPQTSSQVWADYGLPPDITIAEIMENIGKMSWTDREDSDSEETEFENNGANNGTPERNDQKGSRLIETACGIVTAGLKFASDLIGVEGELEPREDYVRYNGYTIRVCGKKLLLESLHVNCDSNIEEANGSCCRSNHSITSCRPTSPSRICLEQSCEGRRVRIVVRVARPLVQDDEDDDEPVAPEHTVRHSDGRWTFICGKGESRDNFMEIECPTGVHPKSLAYAVLNGLLLVDAP